MKKRTFFVFILAAILLLTACGNADVDTSHELETLKSDYLKLQEEYQTLQEENTSLKNQIEQLQQVINASTPDPTPLPVANPVLYTDDYIEISYSHCEESEYTAGEYIIFLIMQNKTDVPMVASVSSFAVDGWNLSDAFGYQEISANSKSYVEISTEQLPTLHPSSMSGDIYIGDRSETAWGGSSYDAIFNSVQLTVE